MAILVFFQLILMLVDYSGRSAVEWPAQFDSYNYGVCLNDNTNPFTLEADAVFSFEPYVSWSFYIYNSFNFFHFINVLFLIIAAVYNIVEGMEKTISI